MFCHLLQIRIEGIIEKLSVEESTTYFHSRPKGSQISAMCSAQSQPVSGRSVLTERELSLKEKFANSDEIPKPEEW